MADTPRLRPSGPLRELRKAEVRRALALAMADLRTNLGRMPSDDELAAHSRVPKRTAARYKKALIGGLPPEFLDALRAHLAQRPLEEPNWLALLRSLLALVRSVPAEGLRLAADRTLVSSRAPETAVTRYESWHRVWCPVLLDDLVRRRGSEPTLDSTLEDQMALGVTFAAMEAAVSIWQQAGLEKNPRDLLVEALQSLMPGVEFEVAPASHESASRG